MRLAALSLILVVAHAWTQSSIQSIDTGRGAIELQVIGGSSKRIVADLNEVVVSGRLTNKTDVTLSGADLNLMLFNSAGNAVEQEGYGASVFIRGRVKPGGSIDLEYKRAAVTWDAKQIVRTEWRMSHIEAPLAYKFKEPMIVKNFAGGKVTASISSTGIALAVENDSDSAIEIAWNETSIIDTARTAKRVFHNGVKYSDRELSQPNTVIPPMARIEDAVTPSANAFFVEGSGRSAGYWKVGPLLPKVAEFKDVDVYLKGLPGKKIVLYLQLIVKGSKSPQTIPFEIESVSANGE